MEPVDERHLRLPAEQLSRARIVCDSVHRPRGHLRLELDLQLFSRVTENLANRIDDARALHRPEIHRGAVVDPLRGEDRAAHDVADIGPVAHLLAVSPDEKRTLLDECARDHRHHCVILLAALAVHGEVATGGGLEAPLARVRLQ